MSEVEIEYCAQCGALDRARSLAAHLLDTLQGQVDEVNVRNLQDHVFRVRVDGEVVYDESGQPGAEDDIVADAVRRAVTGDGT